MVYLTRVEHFNAAHKLWNPAWSAEENKETFGKCANENWHGHNYEIHVTIKGEPQPATGFIFNAKRLSIIIKEYVCDKIDHKNLNLDVDFMAGKFTTAEGLTIACLATIRTGIKKRRSRTAFNKIIRNSKDICGVFRVTLTVIIKMAYKKNRAV